jgi:hypothetical protein
MKNILRLAVPLVLLAFAASPRHASADTCPTYCSGVRQDCLNSNCPQHPSTCQTTCARVYIQCIQDCNNTGG